ncbi:MAG: hypothetical protein OJF48_001919 [Afipia sp.]|jgi:glycosyltransferase involved in cell wall biosynthesis|nr:MAG: hypothetical protein OJF48_001919 [Afipia sp.]
MVTKSAIYFDARSLQDPNYQYRGIGHHGASVTRSAKKRYDRRIVAIIDRSLPDLPSEYESIFDEVKSVAYCEPCRGDWFIQLSPMTHRPLKTSRFLTRAIECTATVVYDFIPYDLPSIYLSQPSERLSYEIALSWLKEYDVYLPISRYSSDRLISICGTDDAYVRITGAAVRDSILHPSKNSPAPLVTPAKIFVPTGGDSRKNLETPLIAHAGSSYLQSSRSVLVISGIRNPLQIENFKQLYSDAGGDVALLNFIEHASDRDLAAIIAGSTVAVCASRIEGFSLPVIEAISNGCPVVVSNCAAQTELVPFLEDQFAPDDADRLANLMERFCSDRRYRKDALDRQKHICASFTEQNVADRFWSAIDDYIRNFPRTAYVSTNAKPRILIDSPLPPDRSGVADWSYSFLDELKKHADCCVITETASPRIPDTCSLVGSSSPTQYLSGRYDRIVSVLGNSHYHRPAFDNLLNYGATSILHDARLIDFYYHELGVNRAVSLATREVGYAVDATTIRNWLVNQTKLPTLFLSEVVDSSKPAIVHSRQTQKKIKELYGQECAYLPFSVYRKSKEGSRDQEVRDAARQRLGISNEALLICTFGWLSHDKGPSELIEAIALMRDQGIPCLLVFVGSHGNPQLLAELRKLHDQLALGQIVRFSEQYMSEDTYRDYLSAADVGVQLRRHLLGSISGALMDCIAAGLPSVANEHLANSMEAPSYVLTVPDQFNANELARSILSASENGYHPRNEEQRAEFLNDHSFDRYCQGLLKLMEIDH